MSENSIDNNDITPGDNEALQPEQLEPEQAEQSEESEVSEESEESDETDQSEETDDYDYDEDPLGLNDNYFHSWKKKGHPLEIIIVAVIALVGLSFVPWGQKTGNFFKDFNLLSDLFPTENDSTLESTDMIDPALEAEMQLKEITSGPVAPKLDDDTLSTVPGSAETIVENSPLDTLRPRNIPNKPNKVGNTVVIEDYTLEGKGMQNLKNALANRNNKPVHITMIGDSYIEGDIITADLRDRFQSDYGGRGVGYLAAHNLVQGFRQTVGHKDNGWTQKPIAQACQTKYFTLAGEYFTGSNGATITLKGVDKSPRLQAWNTTRLMFVAPNAGKITITTDAGERTFDVQSSPGVQTIVYPAETTMATIKSNVSGLILLGVWLQDGNGVVLDNMSIRGDSGITRKYVNTSLANQMRKHVDYSLILVEYGINALSSKQTDYSKYSEMMVEVLQRLKASYPAADIVLLGIGDRGQKIHGEPHSFPTAPNMIEAQRQAAKTAGVFFWDTREAMGGEDAVVRWRNDKLINGDFIHLNFAGGKKLGDLLYESLNKAIKE